MNPIPLPSSYSPPPRQSILVVLDDDRAMTSLIDQLLEKAGISQAEASRRLGVSKQAVSEYKNLKRRRPSIQWLAKLVQVCGGRIIVEFPPERLVTPGDPGSPSYSPGTPPGPRPLPKWGGFAHLPPKQA
jgi:predicted XRE-type DNA-binding protein